MLILGDMKNKDKLESILKHDSSPLGRPGSGLSYRSRVWNQLNELRVNTGFGTLTVTRKPVRVHYGSDPEPFRLQPYKHAVVVDTSMPFCGFKRPCGVLLRS